MELDAKKLQVEVDVAKAEAKLKVFEADDVEQCESLLSKQFKDRTESKKELTQLPFYYVLYWSHL